MLLIDGKKLAQEKLEELKEKIHANDAHPSLAVLLIGENKASHQYVKIKEKRAKEIGIELYTYKFDSDIEEEKVLECIDFLNNDPEIDSLIVQLPLPNHLNTKEIIESIATTKDADGFKEEMRDAYKKGEETIPPVFPTAIMSLLKKALPDPVGMTCTIIRNSNEFEELMIEALEREGIESITSLECGDIHDSTDVLEESDIIITACGTPNLLDNSMTMNDVTIIDGGITDILGKITGDTDLDSFKKTDATITPVPGGVGPMTVVTLLENVYTLHTKK